MDKKRAHKINTSEFIKNYGALIFVWLILLTMLGLPKFSVLNSFLQTLFLLAWTYFGHLAIHYIPDGSFLNKLNPHIFIHHNSETPYPRWFNLLQETIFNTLSFVILLFIQYLLGVNVFSTSIVVATALIYVFVHIFDYSLFGNKEHKEHNKYARCNYAPDFMDVLFDTRCEPDAPYYNENIEIVHSVAAVAITFGLKKFFNWT
jgi:hypothetical protein